ncbi:HAD family hydrolase [Paenibacillus sp. EKM212P]|uniref:HAD family hydrolase n=1 Tax=Paenibacillus sp. EKM212P TaxID=1683680 RepID=UPI0019324A93|nr:HAD-IIB family hydrolase [Paenibacillus sp. EKM212P]
METYKIVCIDIDGTLLNSAHQITEATKETILQVINDKQIPVVLVSARMPKAIIPLQNHLGISEPLICYSGALVIDKHGNKLNTRYIDKKMTQCLLDSLAAYDLHVSLYKDEWYIEQLDAWALQDVTSPISSLAFIVFLSLPVVGGKRLMEPVKFCAWVIPKRSDASFKYCDPYTAKK